MALTLVLPCVLDKISPNASVYSYYYFFFYLLWTVLGLRCCAGFPLAVVQGLLVVVASLVAELGL